MNIKQKLLDILNGYPMDCIPIDKVVITWSPAPNKGYEEPEGLYVWWCRGLNDSFKPQAFLTSILQYTSTHGWSVKEDFQSLSWSMAYLEDPEDLFLGDAFVKSARDFLDYYEKIHQLDKKEEFSVNDAKDTLFQNEESFTIKIKPEPYIVSSDLFEDPEWPVTFNVGNLTFNTLSDVKKYIEFSRLTKLILEGIGMASPEVGHKLMTNILKNQDEIVRLLTELKKGM